MVGRRFFGVSKEPSDGGVLGLVPSLVLALAVLLMAQRVDASPTEIAWREWNDAILQEAQKKGLLVLVSGASKACPWCRKMEDRTYPDAALQKIISASFIPVRVNLRYREELPARFQSLVPPSTLVLSSSGDELFSHRGYLSAEELSRALQDVVVRGRGRSAGSSVRQEVPPFQKVLSTPSFDLQLIRAWQGEADAREWLEKTLDLLRQRVDRDRGGVFPLQSGASDEKLVYEQIFAARAFAQGGWAFSRADLPPLGVKTARHVLSMLSDASGKGAVRSATFAGRESLSERARVMGLLAMLHGMTGDPELRERAEALRKDVVAGTTNHERTLSFEKRVVCAGELATLYSVTAERRVLEQAVNLTRGAQRLLLRTGEAGLSPWERATFARVAYLVGSYSGDLSLMKESRRVAETPAKSIKDESADALVVEAVVEARSEPLHIVVVGAKGDEAARLLWREAQGVPHPYLRREWWDRSEGPLPNPDVAYPKLPRPAAFVCAQKSCSVPLFTAEELRERIRTVLPAL